MPQIGELVDVRKLRPVMTPEGGVTMVHDSRAIEVAEIFHGIERAHVYVGNPVWELANGVKLKAAHPATS